MNILLDCDGILSDFVGGILDELNNRHGCAATPLDITEWDVAKCSSVCAGGTSSFGNFRTSDGVRS